MRLLALFIAGCAPDLGDASAGALEDRCATCHPLQAEEHAASRHSTAGVSPVFVAMRERVEGPELCDACHRPRSHEGVGCLDCHAAAGNAGVKNGLAILDLDGPVRGPTGKADSRAPHATKRSEYLTSADLCGTCHEVEGPAGFSESPYTHWRSSPAAAQGLTCSTCHLPDREPAPIAALPDLSPRAGRVHAPIIDREARLHAQIDGDRLNVDIDNRAGGHHFPDGASFLRQVDVVVTSGGEVVRRIPLAAELLFDGRPTVLPTDADAVRIRGVPAGTIRTETLPVPEEPIEVCLETRRHRPEVLDALGLEPALLEPIVRTGCVFVR
jgi:hypothetical protein